MKKGIKSFILFIIIISFVLLGCNAIYANKDNNIKIDILEKSEEFEKWENLPEEVRKNTIQPLYNTITFKDSIKRSKYNMLLASAGAELEQSYNLKDNLQKVIVKDQKGTGSCWAFSYSSVVETTLAKKYNKIAPEISPMHLDYKSAQIFNRKVGEGGNSILALTYGSNDYAPVYESDFTFDSVYNEEENQENEYYLTDISKVDTNKISKARVEDATLFAAIYKTYSDDSITYKDSSAFIGAKTYSTEEVQAIRKLVKEHIKKYGAISATLYSDIQLGRDGFVSPGGYYNKEESAYYCDKTIGVFNHAITIVGWDDTFSKEKFAEGKQPINDGAYIVLNSYGEEFGENGYFYVSYDDEFIEQQMMGITSIKEYSEEQTNKYYDKIYQHDELGMSTALTMQAKTAYAANVYTRENTNSIEYVSEIGIFLFEAEGVEIYINPSSGDLSQGTKLVGTYTGENALEGGYHILKLAAPEKLTGDKFAIIVKYINAEDISLPVECDLLENKLVEESNFFDNVTSNPGESFISLDGNEWADLYNLQIGQEEDGINITNTNICAKAYTTISGATIEPTTDPVTEGVELDKKTCTVKVGETVTLVATVKGEGSKEVTWSSSNDQVATVENGTVKGIKEGTAEITVKTADNKYSDKCTVTVKNDSSEEKPVEVKVTGVELNKNTHTMQVGDKTNLVATIKPENATNKNVTWSSSNTQVATVSEEGIITAVGKGTTVIKVTTEDGGFTSICNLTVTAKTNSDDDIYKDDNEKPSSGQSSNQNGSNPTNRQPLTSSDQNSNNTVANKGLPYTGTQIKIALFIISVIAFIILYKKYKSFKDIK